VTPTPTVVSGCPAAVSTTDICTTCVTAACVIEATVTVSCECPNPPMTIYSSHPCDLGCDGLGCATVYKVETAACEFHPFSVLSVYPSAFDGLVSCGKEMRGAF